MKTESIVLAGFVLLSSAVPAFSQSQTLTENINNTGIPRNAPALGLANIYGLNPCSSGTTVGLSTPLFGVGGAIASIDKECETRNNAAVVVTGLKDEILAREILCEIKDIREAALRVGKPCLQDQQPQRVAEVVPVKPGVSEPAVASATNLVVTPVVAPVAKLPRMAIRQNAPAFCHIENLDLSLYPDCGDNLGPSSTVGPSGPIKPVVKASPSQPVNKRPSSASDGTASAAAPKRIVRAPRATGCEGQHAQASAACQVAPAAMIALEKNFIKLIDLRRQQLAQANKGGPGTTELRDETANPESRPPFVRGAMLASASPENQ